MPNILKGKRCSPRHPASCSLQTKKESTVAFRWTLTTIPGLFTWAVVLANIRVWSRPEVLGSQSNTSVRTLLDKDSLGTRRKLSLAKTGVTLCYCIKTRNTSLSNICLVFHSTELEQEKNSIIYQSYGSQPFGTAHVVHYVYLPIKKDCRFIFFLWHEKCWWKH